MFETGQTPWRDPRENLAERNSSLSSLLSLKKAFLLSGSN